MKRTFRITFLRAIEPCERESFYPEEDNAPDYVPDETEFDTDCEAMTEIIADMMNLFNDFVAENHFEDVTVSEIYEVPYDGEEE